MGNKELWEMDDQTRPVLMLSGTLDCLQCESDGVLPKQRWSEQDGVSVLRRTARDETKCKIAIVSLCFGHFLMCWSEHYELRESLHFDVRFQIYDRFVFCAFMTGLFCAFSHVSV